MRNSLDTMTIAIDVAGNVAMAECDTLESESGRLALLVNHYGLEKQRAVDIAWNAAVASGMVRKYGSDCIQEIIASGFSLVPDEEGGGV